MHKEKYNADVALGTSVMMSLCCLHGMHRFYIEDYKNGCLECMTCGGCCLWSICDWLNMEKIVEDANRKMR